MSGTQATRRWRFLYSPRWLGWHLLVVASVIGMLWLGDWQLRRAEAGNPLSWAYTFEWPLFAIFAVFFWIKTIRDEAHPGDKTAPDDVSLPPSTQQALAAAVSRDAEELSEAEDPELAAYNAYLARLGKEVKGHGRWHGLR
jgi:hypothetical protein